MSSDWASNFDVTLPDCLNAELHTYVLPATLRRIITILYDRLVVVTRQPRRENLRIISCRFFVFNYIGCSKNYRTKFGNLMNISTISLNHNTSIRKYFLLRVILILLFYLANLVQKYPSCKDINGSYSHIMKKLEDKLMNENRKRRKSGEEIPKTERTGRLLQVYTYLIFMLNRFHFSVGKM